MLTKFEHLGKRKNSYTRFSKIFFVFYAFLAIFGTFDGIFIFFL